jgi:hypothetical protein
MKRKIFAGLTVASLLAGCGSPGLGKEIEPCEKDFETTTEVTDQELEKLQEFGSSLARYEDPQDPTSEKTFLDPKPYDPVNDSGEIACLNEDDTTVLTPGGLALKQLLETSN